MTAFVRGRGARHVNAGDTGRARRSLASCSRLLYSCLVDRFDVDRLDEDWPFEIDHQAGHLKDR